MRFDGSCHCGAVRFELDWPGAHVPVPARRCTCHYCTGFGGTWTSHPQASLSISHDPDIAPQRYRFASGTADFLFCARCGVVVAALDDNSETLKAVVNIRTLDDFESMEFDGSDSDFEGEATDDRLARRARNWIGTVTLQADA